MSSLVFVLYAFSSLIKEFGGVGYSFALTGVIMGGSLLLLSAYWHNVRKVVLAWLPEGFRQYVP